MKDYYLFYLKDKTPKEDLLKQWGEELKNESDVFAVFQCFVTGKPNPSGNLVKKLPWNEEEIQPETLLLKDQLAWCNSNGILTINSQPNVNAAPSADPIVGWGPPGGFVYQRAYLEFFCSRELALGILDAASQFPSVNDCKNSNNKRRFLLMHIFFDYVYIYSVIIRISNFLKIFLQDEIF